MKWLKHMTCTWDDEKVARLVRAGGVEGMTAYGVWWRVLEIVASQMDGKSEICSVTYDVTRWSLLLSLRGSHVRHWLEKLVVSGLVTAEWMDTEVTVTIPKLLKYRDEYSQKSRQTPHKEGETEQIKKESKSKERTSPAAQSKSSRLHMTEPCTEMTRFALEEMNWPVERMSEVWVQFADYWKAKPGKDGCKLDWVATWRNWCRNQRTPAKATNGSLFPQNDTKTQQALRIMTDRAKAAMEAGK